MPSGLSRQDKNRGVLEYSELAARQRHRVPKSCVSCLQLKRACDRKQPSCTRCWQKQAQCIYRTAPLEKPRQSGSRRQVGKVIRREHTNREQSEESRLERRPTTWISERYNSSNRTQTPPQLLESNASTQESCQPRWFIGDDRLVNACDDQNDKQCPQTIRIQDALSGLLQPSSDFVFQDPEKGRASIPLFMKHTLDLLPLPKEAAFFIGSFRRFLRPALPALLDDDFLQTAESFLLSTDREERRKISLSWLAVSLMIIAVGQEVAIEGKSDTFDGTTNAAWLLPSPSSSSDTTETDALLLASHRALCLVAFHSSPSLQTIYCQLLMGLYLLQTERVAAYWPIHGSITRQGQAIGLHIEPKRPKPDQQMRRQIWWAIVQQDVLLSSVFRLPLAVSNFSCLAVDSTSNDQMGSCFRAQAEFAILERRHLMENMHQEWNKEQLNRFKCDLFAWNKAKPESFRMDMDNLSRSDEVEMRSKMRGKTTAAVEAAFDYFIHLQYTILTLYRDRLQDIDIQLKEESYTICANVIHNFVTSLGIMMDLIGVIQAGNVWLRLFYTFHAGVTAAYLAVSRNGSEIGNQAKDDLIQLTSLCQRLPQRYKGLQTINDTFKALLEQIEVQSVQQRLASMHTNGCNDTTRQTVTQQSSISSSEGSIDAGSCLSTLTSGSVNNPDMLDDDIMQPVSEDLFGNVKYNESNANWSSTFAGPFGPTDLLPGSLASGEDILSFWNQYFSQPSQVDAFQFS